MLVSAKETFSSVLLYKLEERQISARKFIEEGNFEQAILEYNKIIFLAPEEPIYYIERAQVYLKIGDLGSAISNYRKATKLSKNYDNERMLSQLCCIKGLTLIDEGSVNSAMEFMEQHLKKDQQFHYLKALGFLNNGEKHQALEELNECIRLDPSHSVEALVMKGKILWSLGLEHEGNEAFWEAFSISSSNPDVLEFVGIMKPLADQWYDRAVGALFEDDLEKAMYFINKGLGIYKESTKHLLLRATIHRKREIFEEALADLEKSSKHMNFEGLTDQVRIQIAITYNAIGQKLFKENKYEEAITSFNEAINYSATDWGFFVNRGDCYKAKGLYETAMADYHHALDLGADARHVNPRLALIHSALGTLLYNAQDYKGAYVEYSRSIYYAETVPDFYVSRAKCQIKLLNLQTAFDDIKVALELDGTHPEAHILLSSFKSYSVPPPIPQRILKLMNSKSKSGIK